MKTKIKNQLITILTERGIIEAIHWYSNICHSYTKAIKVVKKLDKKLSDEIHYHIDFFRRGYIFHLYAEYYSYKTLILTVSLIEL